MSDHGKANPSTNPVSKVSVRDWDKVLSRSSILILAPHMDDETLACGGTIALHSDQSRVYCLFATDGSRSPAPLLPWTGKIDPKLPQKRRSEAVAALAELGVEEANLIFLDLPDGALSRRLTTLQQKLSETIAELRPDVILAPFRLDVHPDHVSLSRAARYVVRASSFQPIILEYFVYYRLRFLPGGDIRECVNPKFLICVETAKVADIKMKALEKYGTQTSIAYPWQDRAILPREALREKCESPEFFVCADPETGFLDIFRAQKFRILFAFFAQRFIKRPKDQCIAMARWLRRATGS